MLISLESQKEERGDDTVFEEMMAENFSTVTNTNLQIQNTEQTPNKINPNKFTPGHTIAKCSRTKKTKKKL